MRSASWVSRLANSASTSAGQVIDRAPRLTCAGAARPRREGEQGPPSSPVRERHGVIWRCGPHRGSANEFLLNAAQKKRPPEGGLLQSISKAYTNETLVLRLRSPTKPRPAKPSAIITQVEGSGTGEALKSPPISALNGLSVLEAPLPTVPTIGLTSVKLKLMPLLKASWSAGITLEVNVTVSPAAELEAVRTSALPPPKTESSNVPLR